MSTEDQYAAQEGTWTLMAPDGRVFAGNSPLSVVRLEQSERIPAYVQMQRLNAMAEESRAEDDTELARLQALNAQMLAALNNAFMWHNGSDWRFGSNEQRMSWLAHRDTLDAAIKAATE